MDITRLTEGNDSCSGKYRGGVGLGSEGSLGFLFLVDGWGSKGVQEGLTFGGNVVVVCSC